MVQIVETWKEQYGIEISYDSERQWRKSNWKLIQKTKQQLIESGEIKVQVIGPKAVSDGLLELSLDTTRTIKLARDKLQSIIPKILVGDNLTPEQQKANRENIKLFDSFTDGLTKLNNSLTKQLSTLVALSGDPRTKPLQEDPEDEEELEDKDFDPTQHQITDADRLLK